MSPATQAQIKFLVERANSMQEEVFSHPPADYQEFTRRLGAWEENQAMQVELAELDRKREEKL